MTSLTMSDPHASYMVNDVSAPSGVSSNDFMVILDSVFLFGSPCINSEHSTKYSHMSYVSRWIHTRHVVAPSVRLYRVAQKV